MASSQPPLVAGFVGADGALTSLFSPGTLRVYEHASGAWRCQREFGFSLAGATGLGEMRTQVHQLAEALQDCRLLLLGEVRGVLPALLGEKGVSVSQVSGDPLEVLSRLPVEQEAPADTGPASTVEAEEVAPGIFRVDLVAAMKTHPGMTSRQVLVPHLSRGGFTLLEVLCDHPPRWLDTDGRKLGYGYEAAPLDDPKAGFLVTLYPDPCAVPGASCSPEVLAGGCSGGCSSRGSGTPDL